MSQNQYEDLFVIDKYLLDKEWVSQPKLYFKYAQELVEAREKLEEAKRELDVTKAEVALNVRAEPKKYSLTADKITEAMITNAVMTQPEYDKAYQDFLAANHRVDILQAVLKSLEHRKRALEKLVDLYGQQYFARPVAPPHAKEAMAEVEKKSARSKRRKGKKKRKRSEDNA